MRNRRWVPLLVLVGILLLAAGVIWNNNRLLSRRNSDLSQNDIQYEKLDYKTAGVSSGYRWPAEFERQEAIWLQWPSEIYSQKSEPVTPAIINIVKALDPYVKLNIIARNSDEIAQIKELLKSSGYGGINAHYYAFDHFSIWTRDVGPVFVSDSQNKLNVVDFGFNNYSRDGSREYIDTENGEHRLIANHFGFPLVTTNLVSEGGAIESNGKGAMMTTEAVALKRNPGMTRQQIEDEYKRVLGVSKVIWLKNGLAEDDNITTGHINEFCRFADSSTILLAQVLPGDRYVNQYSQESYQRLEENYNVLLNATDQDGKSFNIIRIPMPPTMYGETDDSGTLPVRSYLNFAITNGAVLMQTYWKPGRSNALKDMEEGVMETFRGVFAGREIIGIDAESINAWGGGIHCVTQHMPGND